MATTTTVGTAMVNAERFNNIKKKNQISKYLTPGAKKNLRLILKNWNLSKNEYIQLYQMYVEELYSLPEHLRVSRVNSSMKIEDILALFFVYTDIGPTKKLIQNLCDKENDMEAAASCTNSSSTMSNASSARKKRGNSADTSTTNCKSNKKQRTSGFKDTTNIEFVNNGSFLATRSGLRCVKQYGECTSVKIPGTYDVERDVNGKPTNVTEKHIFEYFKQYVQSCMKHDSGTDDEDEDDDLDARGNPLANMSNDLTEKFCGAKTIVLRCLNGVLPQYCKLDELMKNDPRMYLSNPKFCRYNEEKDVVEVHIGFNICTCQINDEYKCTYEKYNPPQKLIKETALTGQDQRMADNKKFPNKKFPNKARAATSKRKDLIKFLRMLTLSPHVNNEWQYACNENDIEYLTKYVENESIRNALLDMSRSNQGVLEKAGYNNRTHVRDRGSHEVHSTPPHRNKYETQGKCGIIPKYNPYINRSSSSSSDKKEERLARQEDNDKADRDRQHELSLQHLQVLKSIAEKPVPQNVIEKFLVVKMYFLCLAIRDFIRNTIGSQYLPLLSTSILSRDDFNTAEVKEKLKTLAASLHPNNQSSFTDKLAQFSSHLNDTEETIYKSLVTWLKDPRPTAEHPLIHALKGKLLVGMDDENVNDWFD